MRKPRIKLYALVHLWRKKSYLKELGWFESYKSRGAVDLEGRPAPLFTYPLLEFLKPRIKPDFSVFEFGSGHSTLWWARNVGDIEAVEHSEYWREKIKALSPANVKLHYVPLEYDGEYCRQALKSKKKHDILVIDGRDRVRCAKYCIEALKDDGVIIWDDTYRECYKEGVDFLFSKGFKKLEFVGLVANSIRRKESSLFYRANNCLGI